MKLKQCNVKKCVHAEKTDKISEKNRNNFLYHCDEFDANYDPDVIMACELYEENENVADSE